MMLPLRQKKKKKKSVYGKKRSSIQAHRFLWEFYVVISRGQLNTEDAKQMYTHFKITS